MNPASALRGVPKFDPRKYVTRDRAGYRLKLGLLSQPGANDLPRTKRTRATTLAKLGLLLAFVACGSFGYQAEQVRLGLVGMETKALIKCLGPPDDLLVLAGDDHQLWVYKRFLFVSTTPNSAVDLRGLGSEGNPMGRFLPAPNSSLSFPAPIASADEARGSSVKVGRETRDPRGLCRLRFKIRAGSVESFEGVGRDHRGLQAENRCVLQAKRCVPRW